MFKQNLLVALRHLRKEKLFTGLNLIGLTLGITCAIITFLFVQYELNYNKIHLNGERIYRVVTHWIDQGSDPEYFDHTTTRMPPYFAESMDQMENYVRMMEDNADVRQEQDMFAKEKILYTDPSLFDVFTFVSLRGNKESFLDNPDKVVISRSFAEKLFGHTDVIGKTVEIRCPEEFVDFMIEGVVADVPDNSDFKADLYVNLEVPYKIYFGPDGQDSWTLQWASAYLLLKEGADPKILEENINQVLVDVGMVEKCREYGFEFYFHLQPFHEHYISFDNPRGIPTQSNAKGVLILMLCGGAILLLAIINFSTFATGKVSNRLNEFGVRKVLGAGKWHFLKLYWLESFILSFVSILISLGICEIFLKHISILARRELDLILSPQMLLFMASITLAIILLSSIYPVLVASRSKIVDVFRNSVSIGGRGRLRKILFLMQVFISVLLVSITLIMHAQLSYLLNKNLGYEKEQIVILNLDNHEDLARKTMLQFRQHFASDPDVLSVSGASCSFGDVWNEIGWVHENYNKPIVYQNTIDYNYLDMMGIDIIEGRNFAEDHPEDWEHSIIINRGFADQMEWKNPIGQSIPEQYGGHTVIGVVEDFNFLDLRKTVEPLVLFLNPEFFSFPGRKNYGGNGPDIQKIMVKVKAGQIQPTLKKLEQYWQQNVPDRHFSFSFLDEKVAKQYHEDRLWINTSTLAAFIALTIGILGMVGMTVMQISRRTKEIGIRKVLGGHFSSIIMLLSKESAILILIANVMAIPLIYLISRQWLEGFAYSISLNVIYIVGGGILVFVISMTTLFLLAYQVSRENPVKALRSE